MTWYTVKKTDAVLAVNPNAENPAAYIFNYDDKYQFQESSWLTNLWGLGNSFLRTSSNKESVITPNNNSISAYDANGNILYLQHTDGTGNYTDQFTYNYAANSNQLTSIDNQATGASQVYASYNYDNANFIKSCFECR